MPRTMGKPSWKKPVIGVVGGIGAGKSTVAEEFVALGCLRVDADRIGHEVLQQPQVRQALVDLWGPGILTEQGQVDRAAVGRLVFSDPQELEKLNRIVHPRIEERMNVEIGQAQDDPVVPAVVLDAAVLFEAGWNRLCSDIVFVQAPDEVRAQRVTRNRGWDKEIWIQREKTQFSLDKKVRLCNHVIVNRSSVPRLREQVRELFPRIIHSAEHSD